MGTFGHYSTWHFEDWSEVFEDGDDFTEIDLSTLADREEKYKQEFVAKFPTFAHLMDRPFKLMTFVHYS